MTGPSRRGPDHAPATRTATAPAPAPAGEKTSAATTRETDTDTDTHANGRPSGDTDRRTEGTDGTAAAPGGSPGAPGLYCPFPSEVSPYAAEAEAHLDDWVVRFEVVTSEVARKRFARAGFGQFAARTYPTADRTRLNLVADWFGWLFLVDDQLDDGRVGRDIDSARSAMAGLLAVLEQDGPAGARGPGEPPLAWALRDLWHRTATGATPAWRRRFRGHLAACLDAACWEAENRITGVWPGEAEYIEQRRHTGAIYVCMDLIDIVAGLDLPEEVYEDELFQAALRSSSDVVVWTNDWYSLGKEMALGEYHNLVRVVEHERGLSQPEALVHTAEAINTETRRYLRHRERLLEAHPAHRAGLTTYLAGMESWMRGNLDWSRATLRYRERENGGLPAYLEATLAAESPDGSGDHRDPAVARSHGDTGGPGDTGSTGAPRGVAR
ncbi:terpene synthase family protein [Streptomyces zingiberis]|uniref:Terpene synthase n=1 Tax=Streptomyces zingiberis TaxID=2053010 RepID=A0ABX1C4R3_9ACTN|nr:terpene cyclase [Streptomyces zingiberis]NJQ03598.1 terpene cyclase [Streptomyces zingiberis]